MDNWCQELALYQLALDVLGQGGLDDWLREQYQRHQLLHGLVTTASWTAVDAGPLVNQLCQWLGGDVELPAERKPGSELPFYCKCQELLFNELIRLLPPERLNEPIRERRLELDMGL
jgi:hypothetical protein